jgi:hypothetical protein
MQNPYGRPSSVVALIASCVSLDVGWPHPPAGTAPTQRPRQRPSWRYKSNAAGWHGRMRTSRLIIGSLRAATVQTAPEPCMPLPDAPTLAPSSGLTGIWSLAIRQLLPSSRLIIGTNSHQLNVLRVAASAPRIALSPWPRPRPETRDQRPETMQSLR